MKKVVGVLFFIFIFLPVFSYAQDFKPGDVVINEIAWMGSTTSANDEWIELKNTTNNDINLSGWKLLSADGKIKINLKGFILANGFYLMERTDDNSVSTVPADLIYKGALSNVGQNVTLYDSQKNSIDQLDFKTKWPAGNNITKQTMERIGANWQTSIDPGGSPKAQNIAIPVLPNDQKTDNTYLSALSEGADQKNINPWLLFLIAIAITIISATILLVIKIKMLKKTN